MRLVVQRVTRASVTVDGEVTGKIVRGYMVLVGAEVGDTEADARLCADKLAGLRVFVDDEGKMNRSVLDVGGAERAGMTVDDLLDRFAEGTGTTLDNDRILLGA